MPYYYKQKYNLIQDKQIDLSMSYIQVKLKSNMS